MLSRSHKALAPAVSLIESIGLFTASMIFFETVFPYVSQRFGFIGVMLYWLLLGIVFIGAAAAVRRTAGGWRLRDLGFAVQRSWLKDIRLGFVIYSLWYIVQIPFSVALIATHASMLVSNFGDIINQPLAMGLSIFLPLVFVVGFITGAFHEEIRFRGYLQGLFSRESSPVIGIAVAFIAFSLPHYFSHPEWTMLQVLNTVPMGIAMGLAYYASGSLIVPMTFHALSNLVPSIAPFFFAKGYVTTAYILIFGIGAILIAVCFAAKKDTAFFLGRMKELAAGSTLYQWIAGIAFGFVFMWSYQGIKSIQSVFRLDKATYLAVLAAISLVCLITSALWFRRSRGEYKSNEPAVSATLTDPLIASFPGGTEGGIARNTALAEQSD